MLQRVMRGHFLKLEVKVNMEVDVNDESNAESDKRPFSFWGGFLWGSPTNKLSI